MLLDLSEIVVRRGMRVDLDVDLPRIEDPDLVFAGPVRGRLQFDNGGDVVSIHGPIDTALTVPCSRCLSDVGLPIHLDVEEHLPVDDILHPNRQPEDGEEWETVVSSIVYLEQGRPILDLDELLRQLIVAEVPIRTLCREDCLGLCARCGQNRNESECACEDTGANRPLAALGDLLG
jgi:uncharacterized protein